MKLNEQYADKIIEQYKTERDISKFFGCQVIRFVISPSVITVWVHDYQLLLLPAILRRKLPRASVGLSMYARFPSMEYLLKVPGKCAISLGGKPLYALAEYPFIEHKHILQGILSADLIGFQV